MKRLVHMSDPHLALLSANTTIEQVGRRIRDEFSPDLCVITGDVAAWGSMERCLVQLHDGMGCDVAFVLGNHDYHGISWQEAKSRCDALSKKHDWIMYLRPNVRINLGKSCLVGQDGWYDVRLGHRDQEVRSRCVMGDLRWCGSTERLVLSGKKGQNTALKFCQEHADKEALAAQSTLETALSGPWDRVFFATHVPPFAESAWHQSAPSEDHWLPIMVSKVMGDMLLKMAARWPKKEIVVLCGHTHSIRRYQAAPNLTVFTAHSGRADLGSPDVSHFFDLDCPDWRHRES